MRFNFFLFLLATQIFLQGCFLDDEKKRESINMGLSPKELHSKGFDLLNVGTLDEGIKMMETLQAAYPSSKYAMQSKVDVIYSLYKNDRFDEAIDNSINYIKLYPKHKSTPYIYYLRALSFEKKSHSILDKFEITDNAERDTSSVKDAFNSYLDLIRKFPNNKYSNEAKVKLPTLRNILSRHELLVAIFYTKKEAHIAAINRCKFIIEKFPNTPSVPAALHLIAHNYDKINAPKLAEDTRRVLNASYPKYTPHYSLED